MFSFFLSEGFGDGGGCIVEMDPVKNDAERVTCYYIKASQSTHYSFSEMKWKTVIRRSWSRDNLLRKDLSLSSNVGYHFFL